MNPVFEAPPLRVPTATPPTATSEDDRSWQSLDAASTSLGTPILSTADSSDTNSSSAVSMRVLGIQGRTSDHSTKMSLNENIVDPPPVESSIKPKCKRAPAPEVHKGGGGGKNGASSKESRYNWRRKGMAEI